MASVNDEISFVGNSGITDKGLPLRGKRVSTMPINQYSPQFNYSSNSKHPFESQPNRPKPVEVKHHEIATKRKKPTIYRRASRIYNKFFNRMLKRYITRRR